MHAEGTNPCAFEKRWLTCLDNSSTVVTRYLKITLQCAIFVCLCIPIQEWFFQPLLRIMLLLIKLLSLLFLVNSEMGPHSQDLKLSCCLSKLTLQTPCGGKPIP